MSLLEGKVFTGKPALLGARDTGPARLPGLGTVSPTGNASLDTWLRQATEVIEAESGISVTLPLALVEFDHYEPVSPEVAKRARGEV